MSRKRKINEDEQDSNDDDSRSEMSSEDDDDSSIPVKARKRARVTKKTPKKSQTKPSRQEKSLSSEKRSKPKASKKTERLEDARKAYKWWEAPKLASGMNWNYLEHPGITFPPPYQPHGIPLLYRGKEVSLSPEQEEMASFYAAMPLDGPQLGNDKTRPVFQRNFFEDFSMILGQSHVVKDFDGCDFSLIRKHLELQRNLKKVSTDEEKLIRKEEKEKASLQYGYALIDGRVEKMGNYNMEPPGLFRGRGEHPKTGKLKRRCQPEAVSLNLSEDAPIPICPIPGHSWQSVRHDPAVTWLCGWTENVQKQNKYVMLAASSSFKGKSDMNKYNKAIKLKSHIHKIRKDYTTKIRSKDKASRELGTAMWVIDVLALRVGGEKGEDEADTVGCCSLRVEHLKFNHEANSYEIELEFLGKDSMLYKQNINFALHGDLGKQVYDCLKQFCRGKGADSNVFDTLSPPVLNKHLDSLMKGLTAKVFRTYNASVTLENELPPVEDLEGLSVQDKVLRYNAANRQVAILCNHQRTITKATETMFENLNEKLQTLKDQLNQLLSWKNYARAGKIDKIPLKEDDQELTDQILEKVRLATAKKEKAKSEQEKLSAASLLDEAKSLLKQVSKMKNISIYP
mmetsp:Transcript_22922/g.25063  ORF Transcript_22922/g.25063 Transcript_22922/m.25063 type:complete len:626 (-) Transcript_22922:4427-6304(-)